MYLPASVHYSFYANDYPVGFDVQHGSGFHLDTANNKVVTKFTCGVALMQAPFYVLGATINVIAGADADPYSRFYLFFINIGLAFYCALGLYCLKKWLEHYVDPRSAFLAMLITFFGTNMYYYSLDESLMSHAYSFVLLCAALYAMKRWTITSSFRYFILLSFVVALATLIRPTSILFALIVLFLDISNAKALMHRLRMICSVRNLLSAVAIFVLVFIPQMLYWKFAYDQYIVWSYVNEGFTNWKSPWFMSVWFSPKSGLFPYTPIVLVALIIAVYGCWKRKANSILVLTVFLGVSYLCAAWINPNFGDCNFGKRPMVEYMPLLMLPVAWGIHAERTRPGAWKWILNSVVAICVLYNLWLFGGFDTCFGGSQWEWSRFGEIISNGTLLP